MLLAAGRGRKEKGSAVRQASSCAAAGPAPLACAASGAGLAALGGFT